MNDEDMTEESADFAQASAEGGYTSVAGAEKAANIVVANQIMLADSLANTAALADASAEGGYTSSEASGDASAGGFASNAGADDDRYGLLPPMLYGCPYCIEARRYIAAGASPHGACILTAENMHTADDCTLHDHEPFEKESKKLIDTIG